MPLAELRSDYYERIRRAIGKRDAAAARMATAEINRA